MDFFYHNMIAKYAEVYGNNSFSSDGFVSVSKFNIPSWRVAIEILLILACGDDIVDNLEQLEVYISFHHCCNLHRNVSWTFKRKFCKFFNNNSN